ncbi:MAG: hypothetical protein KFF73_10535 [Cyclobacteriaceae bacterium]|nr:hypothetical protein [Cyclobacteriaceae bacterium]
MKHEDFIQLSPILQREFTLNACQHLTTFSAGQDIQIDLFHSPNGEFFVEFVMNKQRKELLFIKSYHGYLPLYKYLQQIDITEAYRVLNL